MGLREWFLTEGFGTFRVFSLGGVDGVESFWDDVELSLKGSFGTDLAR